MILEFLVASNMYKTKENLALGALHQLWEDWRKELAFYLSWKFRVCTDHTLYLHTPNHRAATEQKGFLISKGELVVAQIWTEVLFKRLLFFWNLHILLSTEIIHQGRPRPLFTLALSYFYAQGFRSWEGVGFIISYNLEYETRGLHRLCCVLATTLCGRGRICWINVHLRALGFPVAQTVKNLPAVWETWVHSLDWEDPLQKGMATHSSILAWRIPCIGEPGSLQSMGSQRVRHN